jgi:hypothetical protein
MAGVDRREFENVSEELAVSFGIFAVEDDMGTVDHKRWPPSDRRFAQRRSSISQ